MRRYSIIAFWGPYPVAEVMANDVYKLELPANLRTHNAFHISMVEKAHERQTDLDKGQPLM